MKNADNSTIYLYLSKKGVHNIMTTCRSKKLISFETIIENRVMHVLDFLWFYSTETPQVYLVPGACDSNRNIRRCVLGNEIFSQVK